MNKKKLLFILKKKRIPFVNLTVDLKNKKKDLDIFIKKNSKLRFEKFIYGKNFYKRKLPVFKDINRFFYYNETFKNKFIIDVSYKISFKKSAITRYVFDIDKFKDIKKNSRIIFFIYHIGKIFWEKKNSINQINKFIFKPNFRNIRNQINIKKKFEDKLSVEEFLKSYFHKKINISKNSLLDFNSNLILFLGSDGTGKSSIINNLNKELISKTFITSFGTAPKYWFSNFLLKSSLKLKYINFIYLSLLFLDFFMRRLKIFFMAKNHFILIDRYPGFIYGKKKIFFKLIKLILPRPKFIILLTASKKIRLKRKPNEFKKNDFKKWENIINYYKLPTYRLNTSSSSIKTNSSKIIKYIFKYKNFYKSILND